MRRLELLSPAKNLECGIAAIDHGADAVYIGPSRFGARAAVGNSIDDIRQLCTYAHRYGAKVYVTVNTIVYDHELTETYRLLEELAEAQVDAVLVQDMAVAQYVLNHPEHRMALHASTQTDNRSSQKVQWLSSQGFSRVVLARELSVDEIKSIHQHNPATELEVFVHGALCVSYSGLCYASQYCFSRSANRGECAQFCRMPFDLADADGKVLQHNRHLLSLKDLCLIDSLEALADAGATSFKIEGRLKDVAYVKNVTAAYSQELDKLVSRYPQRYCRASRGQSSYTFVPSLQRTFNRGYTHYFIHGRQGDITSFDTPKAMGQFVGVVKELRSDSFTVAGTASFANGDGFCFLDHSRQLQGFRVNRVSGNRLFPQRMPAGLCPGVRLFRNNDQKFERQLSKRSAERKIPLDMRLEAFDDGGGASGFSLLLDDGFSKQRVRIRAEHQLANKPQRDRIVSELSKLGNTPYVAHHIDLANDFPFFIPASTVGELRRLAVEVMQGEMLKNSRQSLQSTIHAEVSDPAYPQPHLYNVANSLSARIYGVEAPTAYELTPAAEAVLMQCRHCLRYALGYCVKHGGRRPSWREPLFLCLADGRRFRLEFDCRNCQMNVYAADS